MRTLITLFVAALLASGCASFHGNTINVAREQGQEAEAIHIAPFAFVGVKLTDRIKAGNFKAYRIDFPDGLDGRGNLFPDFHPLRFRYQALAYGRSGKAYPAQALYAGYIKCALRMVFIVEGDSEEIDRDAVVGVVATTMLTNLFALHGESIVLKTPERIALDAEYRKDAVLQGGTTLSSMKEITKETKQVFGRWATVGSTDVPFKMLTPLPESLVRIVSRTNPEYSPIQKLVGNMRGAISPDVMITTFSALSDLYASETAPDRGWDARSVLTRGEASMLPRAIAAEYNAALRAGMVCGGPQ